jgi:hypothetical protein
MEKERLAHEYALVPGREARALQREEMLANRAEREQARKDQTTAGYIGAAGNVAGLGMQYLNYQNNKDYISKLPDRALTGMENIPIYTAENPAPRTIPRSTVDAQGNLRAEPSMTTGNYPGMYSNENIPKTALTTNDTSGGLNFNPPPSPLVNTGNTAMGAAGSALGAYKTYQDVQQGDYLNAGLDATKTGIAAYKTVDTASKALTGTGVAAGTAIGQAAGKVLPVVSAAISAGQGIADISNAKNAKDAIAGVWRVVDGVLQYVVPQYGWGRAGSQVVDAVADVAGAGNSPIKNNIQDIFDPAGMLAGQRKGNSMYNSVFGKE